MKKASLFVLVPLLVFVFSCKAANSPKVADVSAKQASADKPASPEVTPINPEPAKKKFKNSIGMEFVYIPSGTFRMGSPSDELQRMDGETQIDVTLTKGFYMQTTEATQGQWRDVMGTYPSQFSTCGYECPVENISWNDTIEFIKALNVKEHTDKYRLPTEAEWEYACRAGTKTTFYNGDCLSSKYANYDGRYPLIRQKKPLFSCPKDKYKGKTMPVASFEPNAWGLYDMHGNVHEACQDWYGDYPAGPLTDPTGAVFGNMKVYRGGSWSSDSKYCRSACRNRYSPDHFSSLRGFRLVYSAE